MGGERGDFTLNDRRCARIVPYDGDFHNNNADPVCATISVITVIQRIAEIR